MEKVIIIICGKGWKSYNNDITLGFSVHPDYHTGRLLSMSSCMFRLMFLHWEDEEQEKKQQEILKHKRREHRKKLTAEDRSDSVDEYGNRDNDYKMEIIRRLMKNFNLEDTKQHYRTLGVQEYVINPSDFSLDRWELLCLVSKGSNINDLGGGGENIGNIFFSSGRPLNFFLFLGEAFWIFFSSQSKESLKFFIYLYFFPQRGGFKYFFPGQGPSNFFTQFSPPPQIINGRPLTVA